MTENNRYKFLDIKASHAQISIVLSALVAGLSFLFLSGTVQFFLIVLGALSIAYVLPLISQKRLRDLWGMKIVLISAVWAALPVLIAFQVLLPLDSLLIYLEHFFFIFALTIPFDVRDIHLDKEAQVSNLNERFSISNLSLFVKVFLVLCSLLIVVLTVRGVYHSTVLISLFIFYILQYITTRDLNRKRGELFYLLTLDGFILLKGLIYVTLSI